MAFCNQEFPSAGLELQIFNCGAASSVANQIAAKHCSSCNHAMLKTMQHQQWSLVFISATRHNMHIRFCHWWWWWSWWWGWMVGDDTDDVDDGWRWSPRVRSCWLGGVASLPTPCPEHSPSKKEDKMVILILLYDGCLHTPIYDGCPHTPIYDGGPLTPRWLAKLLKSLNPICPSLFERI